MGQHKITLTTQILIAMLTGIGFGIIFNISGHSSGSLGTLLFDGVFRVVGAIFIAALKMMVVPLVLISLVCGVTNMGDLRALG